MCSGTQPGSAAQLLLETTEGGRNYDIKHAAIQVQVALLIDDDGASCLDEFGEVVGQFHQFVLDLRIPAPSCDYQKPHHDPFQVLTPLRRQPICRGCRTSGVHAILDSAMLPRLSSARHQRAVA
jgi:hypothetical protein